MSISSKVSEQAQKTETMQICLGGFNRKWLKQEIERKIIVLLIWDQPQERMISFAVPRETMKL